jgi:transcriptional regulator
MDETVQVVKGTVDLLVLKALSTMPMHGFEITTWIEDQSGGSLDFDDSAIYQAVYRLERRALVKASWGMTENNRRARYYRITKQGQDHLRDETRRMLQFAQLLAAILQP